MTPAALAAACGGQSRRARRRANTSPRRSPARARCPRSGGAGAAIAQPSASRAGLNKGHCLFKAAARPRPPPAGGGAAGGAPGARRGAGAAAARRVCPVVARPPLRPPRCGGLGAGRGGDEPEEEEEVEAVANSGQMGS